MEWLGLAVDTTSAMPSVDSWIHHAKFHATSDDRGYATGHFDWDRFYDALSDQTFKPCCGAPADVVRYRVNELLSAEWWDAYREAFLMFVAEQRDMALVAA